MPAPKKRSATVDDYITAFPKDVQRILTRMRRTIHKAAPEATETISYQIPTFRLRGRNLIYFAAWKHHVSVYPIPTGTDAFKKEISPYKKGRGTLQFPLDQPVPYDLLSKVVTFRVKESLGKKR